ncbi:hypothetical protein SCOR_22225 [Sulfidibacter corallicola]|uniref:Uncharacterized protein n=1 Tax=Sulfidibacter corallicola TaxID=2818388 RepID=A0A8A4TUQ5_SULCO|nr:hypothetical protein [Sulfidibacter corallicola]QTD52864.1 hypothetical protein J3U87_10335 [Sulfidibacter corallicola]
MDFHAEFSKSVNAFPCIEGLIFADPDGESILFEAPNMVPFDVKLAGAKLPILMQVFRWREFADSPTFMELKYEDKVIMAVRLSQFYSITVICNDLTQRYQLKRHLEELAAKFNQEIF